MLQRYAAGLQKFANDEFVSVALPRTLIIKNARLGVVFKGLQVVFFLVMITYCVSNEVWRRASPAKGWATVIWSEGGQSDGNASSPDAAHCANSSEYHYNFSAGWSLKPQGCRSLPDEEAASKGPSEDQLFITTFVRDTTTWQGAGAACSETTRLWCEGDGTAQGLYSASPGGCSCFRREEYFARNAEALTIFFNHGYEVDTSDGRGLSVTQGSSASPSVLEGPRGQMEERKARMVTVVQREDGTPCEIGGRRSWENDGERSGVSGTLGEFLACAGVTLDTHPRSVMPAGGLAPHLRTMGFSLELQLHHTHNLYDPGTSCVVRVRATPLWSWRHYRDTVRLPGVSGDHEELQHSRYTYGVAINMKVSGQFYTFDIVKLVTAFTSLLVILQLPRYITQFIALYCLGLTSEIYRNAKRARLNIFEHFHGAVARMLLAAVGFRGLLGGVWHGRVSTLGGLTESLLFRHVKDAFHQQVEQGILQRGELRRMVHIIFKNMDVSKTGTVTYGDFINSCTANDHIDLQSMARFFDDDKEVGFMQGYLDNTDQIRREFTNGTIACTEREDDRRVTTVSPDDRRPSAGSADWSETTDSQDMEEAGSLEVTAGHLEADDVRNILGEGLEPLHKRVCKLEALDLRGHIDGLEQRMTRAAEMAERAAQKANKATKDLRRGMLDVGSPEPPAPEAPQGVAPQEREFLRQVPSLSLRVQQLDDTITLMQENLEARTAELEAAVLREASQDLQSESLKLCRCLEERMKRLEADVRSAHGGTGMAPREGEGRHQARPGLGMPQQQQQPSMYSAMFNFFPTGRRAQDPTGGAAPAEVACEHAQLQGREPPLPCDPILLSSLNQSPSSTPVPMHVERGVTAVGPLAPPDPTGSAVPPAASGGSAQPALPAEGSSYDL